MFEPPPVTRIPCGFRKTDMRWGPGDFSKVCCRAVDPDRYGSCFEPLLARCCLWWGTSVDGTETIINRDKRDCLTLKTTVQCVEETNEKHEISSA